MYHSYTKALSKYLMHTAKECWTQQIARDTLVVEVLIRHLDVSSSCSSQGLVLGISQTYCHQIPWDVIISYISQEYWANSRHVVKKVVDK